VPSEPSISFVFVDSSTAVMRNPEHPLTMADALYCRSEDGRDMYSRIMGLVNDRTGPSQFRWFFIGYYLTPENQHIPIISPMTGSFGK
jgi:hypothetical protein